MNDGDKTDGVDFANSPAFFGLDPITVLFTVWVAVPPVPYPKKRIGTILEDVFCHLRSMSHVGIL